MTKPLTGRGDAVEANKGVEAGGGTRQHTSQAERSKTTHAKLFFHTERGEMSDTSLTANHWWESDEKRVISSYENWLKCQAAVGLVYIVPVVIFRQVPVGGVSLDKTGDGDEAQHHQIDASEDLVH